MCKESEDGFEKKVVKFGECSKEVRDEFLDYYQSRNKFLGGFAKFAMCLDEEDEGEIAVQGDPFACSHSYALSLGAEFNDSLSEDDLESLPQLTIYLVIEYDQVVMKN